MQSVTLPQPITRENKSRIRLQTVFEMLKIEIRNLLYVFTNFLQSESNITVLTDVQKKKKETTTCTSFLLVKDRNDMRGAPG